MSKLCIPAKVLDQHVIVLGKTGAGKSSVMRLLVEWLLEEKKPLCIIDPKGDWHGLRSSADGKRAGYPVVIFGGEHADVPVNALAGGQVAELVGTGNRPCLIDLGGWTVADRTRFFIDFAQGLFRAARGQRWLVVDEIHNFAPQQKIEKNPDAMKMLHWANRLASEGRGKGIQIMAASQRPQKVHKDLVTSCETLIAMRVIHPLDRNAVKEWIDGCPDREKGREVLDSLASMPRGTGWVWSPEIGFGPKQIAFPKFSTFDSFAPPQAQGKVSEAGWAEVDLGAVKEKLAAVIQEHKANDPAELRRQVAVLKKELAQRPESKAERVEVPVLGDKDRALIDKATSGFERLQDVVSKKVEELRDIYRELNTLRATLGAKLQALPASATSTAFSMVKSRVLVAASSAPRVHSTNGTLPRCERAILTALAQYPQGRSVRQIAILTGYSVNSGGFNNALSALRSEPTEEKHFGECITRGNPVKITESGLASLGHWESLPVGAELARHWMNKLPKCERSILGVLMENPGGLSLDEISEKTGYARSSGGFNNALSRLRTLELITRGQPVRASEELFEA